LREIGPRDICLLFPRISTLGTSNLSITQRNVANFVEPRRREKRNRRFPRLKSRQRLLVCANCCSFICPSMVKMTSLQTTVAGQRILTSFPHSLSDTDRQLIFVVARQRDPQLLLLLCLFAWFQRTQENIFMAKMKTFMRI
jgi:hypothetical protein